MKKDPVCGMQVDENRATISSTHEGERYVFCSTQCKQQFDRNPQQYVKQGDYAHHGMGQQKGPNK